MSVTGKRTKLEAAEAALCGMTLALHAREAPERPAIYSPAGDRTYDELNARANQLVRALRARGLQPGDAVALVCSNRPEFAEVCAAATRSGLRLTPINFHLTAGEIAYILENCEAKAFVGDARFADAVEGAVRETPGSPHCLAVGGEIEGFDPYDKALAEQPTDDLDDPALGGTMLYTSGTTGRPKGVYRRRVPRPGAAGLRVAQTVGYRPGEDTHLCTGPAYHAAPLAFSVMGPLRAGVGIVMMDGWNAERAIALMERYRITHTHMVPTMFHRLLALPEEVRARHDLSALRFVLHGAAPCPVEVKKALIEWLGPIVHEYYAATEGGGTFVSPEVWLERPGTVGKPEDGHVRIVGEGGETLPPGEVGKIYLRASPDAPFEYYKDEDKTSSTYDADRGRFTLGDMGYLDEDGYLFLADRSADLIISGGVNIYPAEVDAVLLQHPAVGDVATIGVPNDEWGEEVRSVVLLKEGLDASDPLAEELVAFCRERLAHFKCPRKVDFTDTLPRHDTGKILRRLVRERYR